MMKSKVSETPVDEGYSWVILIACFGIYVMLAGSVKCIGILYTEFLGHFNAGAGHTAWIGSVCMFLVTGSGPFANCLVEIFSFRKVTFIGGVLVSLGYFLSAFVPYMELMYLTIGIISGIGYGQLFAPVTTIINFYFEKRRALAVGLMASGSGIGSFILPYFYRYIIDLYGVMGALIIISGTLSHICVFAVLLRQPRQTSAAKRSNKILLDENETCHFNCCIGVNKPQIKCSLFKNPAFSIFAISMTINAIGFASNFIVLPAHTEALGFSKQDVALIFSISGACEIFTKPFTGWIVDRKVIEPKTLLLVSYFIPGVFGIFIPLFPNLPALAVYSGMVGIFPGLYTSLISIILVNRVGLDLITPAVGLSVFCLAFGLIISQPIAGWLEDMTGTWEHSFYYIAGVHLLAFSLLILEPCISRYWCVTYEDTDTKLAIVGTKEVMQEEFLLEDSLEQKQTKIEDESEMLPLTLLDTSNHDKTNP